MQIYSSQNDGLALFTTSGASCGTVTHSLSSSPVSDLFSTYGNGYSWYSSDNSRDGAYTVTVTATEDGCGATLSDSYMVVAVVNCENLDITPPASITDIVYEVVNVG